MSTGLVHYLALTFSTLLSSQASGAHRAGAFFPAWGNSTYFTRLSEPSQTRSRTSSPSVSKAPDRTAPRGSAAGPVVSIPVGFLRVGRRRSARSLVSCTPMRPCLLYAPDAARSNPARFFFLPRPKAQRFSTVRRALLGSTTGPPEVFPAWSRRAGRRGSGRSRCPVPRRGLDYFRRPRWRAQGPPHRRSSCRAAGSRSGRAAGRPDPAPRQGR
jgi:hypothetical protein